MCPEPVDQDSAVGAEEISWRCISSSKCYAGKRWSVTIKKRTADFGERCTPRHRRTEQNTCSVCQFPADVGIVTGSFRTFNRCLRMRYPQHVVAHECHYGSPDFACTTASERSNRLHHLPARSTTVSGSLATASSSSLVASGSCSSNTSQSGLDVPPSTAELGAFLARVCSSFSYSV